MKQQLFGFSIAAGVLAALTMSGLATAAENVPFKGGSGGLITNAGFDPVENIVYLHQSGTGQATHLGSFTVESNHQIHVSTGTARINHIWTAANGDKLFLTSVSGMPTGPTTAAGTLRVIGGTGRFEGATGLLQVAITFAIAPPTLEPNPYTNTIEGTISFKQ